MDYQKTLNLPNTDFAMKANLAVREPTFLEKWEKDQVYADIKKQSASRPKYILHDGPPYANGNIHIGHALNKILKDFIVKSKTMQGFNAIYVPGWDCHGLPIEHQLLKDLKKNKSEVECVEFRKKAHEYAMKYVGIQRDQFKRLGIFGEWDDPYLTLDPQYEYWILKSLATLNQKGYVYRGLKPVNWCFSCETALAEAEVEYEDHVSPSVYVKFKVNNFSQVFAGYPTDKDVYLLIWTTTPWTLLANVAVAVHPHFEYNFIDTGKEILIIESSLSAQVLQKVGILDFVVLKKLKGDELTELVYSHPFGILQNCKVVMADYVTKEDGTGLVHTAPGHGADDFRTGLWNKLEILMPVDDRGVYTKDAGSYAGKHVSKVNEEIILDLKQQGKLFHRVDITHSYPHCWRCKKPIIFRATKQWFLKVDHDNLRERIKEIIKTKVQWIPSAGEERILGMIGTRPDWCLSRQRFWGVPIPAIKCKSCAEITLNDEVIHRFADIVQKEGTNSWFIRPITDFIPSHVRCVCGHGEFERTNDILDVWFDSGVSSQAVVKAKMKGTLPADMYLEGSDQHRGWFQSSIIPAVAIEGQAPFKAVLTHGFVVDGQGRKMSKSLGNVVSPHDIIKNSGADILRLWVAASSYNEDIRISTEIVDRLIDAYRKIRNTFRYILGNLSGFDPNKHILPYENLTELDKWALSRLAVVIQEIKEQYNQYDFARVYKAIYNFCNEDLSSFYLDILKDRLYTSAALSQERLSAQSVLYYILDQLVRVSAPLLSFTADEVFVSMPKTADVAELKSVHLLDWKDIPSNWTNPNIEDKFKWLVTFRPFVLKALDEKRKSGMIGSSLEAKLIFNTASDRDWSMLNIHKSILASIFIVSQVEIHQVSAVANPLGDVFTQTEVIVLAAEGMKCSRCWNYKVDVGQDSEHQTLCARCTSIVKEF